MFVHKQCCRLVQDEHLSRVRKDSVLTAQEDVHVVQEDISLRAQQNDFLFVQGRFLVQELDVLVVHSACTRQTYCFLFCT